MSWTSFSQTNRFWNLKILLGLEKYAACSGRDGRQWSSLTRQTPTCPTSAFWSTIHRQNPQLPGEALETTWLADHLFHGRAHGGVLASMNSRTCFGGWQGCPLKLSSNVGAGPSSFVQGISVLLLHCCWWCATKVDFSSKDVARTAMACQKLCGAQLGNCILLSQNGSTGYLAHNGCSSLAFLIADSNCTRVYS